MKVEPFLSSKIPLSRNIHVEITFNGCLGIYHDKFDLLESPPKQNPKYYYQVSGKASDNSSIYLKVVDAICLLTSEDIQTCLVLLNLVGEKMCSCYIVQTEGVATLAWDISDF